jgi:hypothetical protein
MAIRSLKNGTFSRSLLVGNTAYDPPDFESIATVFVGSGGAANVEFTSIPSTFAHLQIRAIIQTNRGTYTVDEFNLQVNGVTSANYSRHELLSSAMSNDTPYSQGSGSETKMANIPTISGVKANYFGAAIIDILDYANTNKYKTLRYLGGADSNGDTVGLHNVLGLGSGALYVNTNAITSIKMYPQNGTQFNQYSRFALYGVK